MKAPFPPSEKLIQVLESDTPDQAKALACQHLAIVGGPGAIPALAKLLQHEYLSDYARSALQNLNHPAAADALRTALPTLKDQSRGGVIDSLGILRDNAAVPVLAKFASALPESTAHEALAALGKISTPEAIAALKAAATQADTRLTVIHASLAAAERLIKDGQTGQAKSLLEPLASLKMPGHLADAIRGMISRSARRPIFNGTSFDGWEGDEQWFRIAEGAVVAGNLNKAIPQNEFLCTRQDYSHFDLRLKVRLVGGNGNAGIQFRSQRVPNSREMSGYQADVGAGYWGGLYDESRRNRFLAQPKPATIGTVIRPFGWNHYAIRCQGARIRLWLNGVLTVDFTETDEKIPQTGRIGLQIHSGAPAEAWYKDIELEELPT